MPGFDRSGPNGEGSKTGRARGLCAGNQPLSRNFYGRGNGRGLGRGRGYRYSQVDSKEALALEKKMLEDRIQEIDKQIG